jgi:hypothetical protein
VTPSYVPYHFPDPDLLWKLLDIYFCGHSMTFPLLHRPSFERSLADGLHYRNRDFGNLVLVVCSLAARFTDDPKVLINPTDPPQSAGWRWFNQIRYNPDWDIREPISLHRTQMIAVRDELPFLRLIVPRLISWILRPSAQLLFPQRNSNF